MSECLGWGILGTGNIAEQFAAGISASRRGRIVAVGSRRKESATVFAGRFSIPAAYPSYDALLADPSVEAVYVSLPNTLHHEWTIKSLQAGKHVLCEKPIAVSTLQAREMFDLARQTGRVLVEAFMYCAHPQTIQALQQVRGGAIGRVKLIRTSFCYRTSRIAGNIRFDPRLAGGSLMDIGCYCVSFSHLVTGEEPDRIHAVARMHPTGIDEQISAILHYPSGAIAEFTCGMTVQADNTAYICGDEGYIAIPVPWKPVPNKGQFTIARATPPRQDLAAGKPVAPPRRTIDISDSRDVYAVEADAFAACVHDGAPPFVTSEQTIGTMRTVEAIRREAGLPLEP